MDLNIISYSYLFLRLAPFFLVCFFTLSSVLNQDFKGLIYIAGLLLSCFFTILIGNALSDFIPQPDGDKPEVCNMISIGSTGDISKLPLGQLVIVFTFGYLLYPLVYYNLLKQNIPTLIFFPLLLLFDMIWNVKNSCYTPIQIVFSLILGGLLGVGWGYIIDQSKNPALQYFAGSPNGEVCSAPSNTTFKCNVYKNGELISQNSMLSNPN
jgi:hypothetical protein